jgi:hypothetical protein
MSNEPQKSDSTRIILIVVGAVAGLVLLAVVVCGGLAWLGLRRFAEVRATAMQVAAQNAEARAAVELFLEALAAGEVEVAYTQTSRDFQTQQGLAGLRTILNKNPALGHHTSRVVTQITLSGGRGSMTLSVSGPKGTTSCSVVIVREDGAWKMHQFSVP